MIWVDEAHHNIVATAGRYHPFVASLQADGYVVKPFGTAFSPAALEGVGVLVIGNPLHSSNLDDWSLPAPSAYTAPEIRALFDWVDRGGALLLLVDHMPFPGAAGQLAQAFGVEFLNGCVEDPATWEPVMFRRSTGTLVRHQVTDGVSTERLCGLVPDFVGCDVQKEAGLREVRMWVPDVEAPGFWERSELAAAILRAAPGEDETMLFIEALQASDPDLWD